MNYREQLEDLRDELEARYNLMLATGSNQEAYNILGELMRFKLIDKNDNRLSKSYMKYFEKVGVDTSVRFFNDMRTISGGVTDNFLPDNLYESIRAMTTSIELVCRRHWTKRRELQYVGDIVAPQRSLMCTLSPASTPGAAKAYIENIQNMYFKNCNKRLKMNTYEQNMTGQQKIYKITLCSGENFLIRDFGYVIIDTAADGRVSVSIMLDNNELYAKYISIKQTLYAVESAVIANLNIEANSEKLTIRYMGEPERWYSKQQKMLTEAEKSQSSKEIEIEKETMYKK